MTFPDWTGKTVACIASGPSLIAEDCERVRGLPTIVTNTTFRTCLWANAVFGFDLPWWAWHMREVKETFSGLRFCDQDRRDVIDARDHPRYRSFGNSGACAIALAVACGAKRVLMLGFDCQLTGGKTHHHGNHRGLRNCDTLPKWPRQFAELAQWSKVPIVNASRVSALTCFERLSLEDALDLPALARVADGAPSASGAAEVRLADHH